MPVSFSSPIKVVVFDIEGTICPITFVKDVLFPYFLQQVPRYLSQLKYPIGEHSTNDPQLTQILSGFPPDVLQTQEDLHKHIVHLVESDQKVAPLKSFQGVVWKQGYESGQLVAPLYDDAIKLLTNRPPSVEKYYIYSSGSVKAQQLLFSYVRHHDKSIDLKPQLAGYFDITTSGYKQQPSSYTSILKDIGYEGDNSRSVLFLSDNVKEVEAALEAGLNSVIVEKPGNAPLSNEDRSKYTVITTLDDLQW